VSEAFRLTKWYLDVASTDLSPLAAIGYWTSLDYQGLAIAWHSVSRYAADGAATSWSLARTAPPGVRDGMIEWNAPALKSSFETSASATALRETLWSDENGKVEWSCAVPAGLACVQFGDGSSIGGTGYVERLEMTIAPWQLGIRELRWGRWCDEDARRSLVWIDWRGKNPRKWVFLDGQRVEAEVSDTRVAIDDQVLELSLIATLENRVFGDIVSRIPGVSSIAPRTVRDIREQKWLSRGELRSGNERLTGRAIHEAVIFP
jgi:hypothetical protein